MYSTHCTLDFSLSTIEQFKLNNFALANYCFLVTNFNGKRNSFWYFIKMSRENFALFSSFIRLRSENEWRFIPTLCSLEMKALHVQKREQRILRGGVAGCTTPEMRKSLCRFPRDLVTPRGSSRDYSANPTGTTRTTTSRGWDRTTALIPLLSSCKNLLNRSPQCCTTQLYTSSRRFDFTS